MYAQLLSTRRRKKLLDVTVEAAELPYYEPWRTEIPFPLETMLGESHVADLRENNVKKG